MSVEIEYIANRSSVFQKGEAFGINLITHVVFSDEARLKLAMSRMLTATAQVEMEIADMTDDEAQKESSALGMLGFECLQLTISLPQNK